MKKRYWIVLILILVGFGLWKYFYNFRSVKKTESVKVTVGKIDEKLTLPGLIDATNKAVLRFPTLGKITWMGVTEGQTVKKWQALASIDRAALQVTATNAHYKYLSADANAKLVEDQVSGHDKDESLTQKNNRVAAQAARDQAFETWQQANRDLTNATLFSPLDGIATSVPQLGMGSFISSPTQAEFTVIDPESIYFSASADQSEVGRLSAGQTGELTLDAFPVTLLSGSIFSIGFVPKSGESSTVYEVKFKFMPFDKYRLGMTGDLTFVTASKKNILLLPSKYIKSEGVKKYVLISIDKKQKKYIETGLESDSETEIVSGLHEGEVVYE